MTGTAQKEPLKAEKKIILTNSLFTQEELDEFKDIAFKEHGVKLTDEEAFEQASALFNLFDYLIKKGVEEKRKRVNMDNIKTIV
jgi:hypothetical protein